MRLTAIPSGPGQGIDLHDKAIARPHNVRLAQSS